MIEQYKKEKAGNDYAVDRYGVPTITCEVPEFHNGEEDFRAGANWAESQMEELAIEFIQWLSKKEFIMQDIYEYQAQQMGYKYQKWSNHSCIDITEENSYFNNELFKQFLKERADEKSR